MERWVEHYLELYSTENTITAEALDTTESMSVMTELDTEPTEDDLSKAIDSLKNGKARKSMFYFSSAGRREQFLGTCEMLIYLVQKQK